MVASHHNRGYGDTLEADETDLAIASSRHFGYPRRDEADRSSGLSRFNNSFLDAVRNGAWPSPLMGKGVLVSQPSAPVQGEQTMV
jgi:hypothetical protein